MQEFEEILKIRVTIQGILVVAFIIQLIANLVIIIQLPQIKKYIKLIYKKLNGFDEKEKNYETDIVNTNKENENNTENKIIEKSMESLNKETIKNLIAMTLVGIFAILFLLFLINK